MKGVNIALRFAASGLGAVVDPLRRSLM
jgi:hypothetical protein